jgi:hypothetical protein
MSAGALLLQFHVAISLVGIATGLVVVYGLVTGKFYPGWTAVFLSTTILTSLSGFPLAPFGFDPARAIGVLLLILMAVAVAALYGFHLAGVWRWLYVGGAVIALYLNVFVGVVQAFQKLSFLEPLAPTQSEPPFVITQVVVLAAFIVIGVVAGLRFNPAPKGHM